MKIKPWIAGAAWVTAVTIGFGTSASATIQHRVPHVPRAGAHVSPPWANLF